MSASSTVVPVLNGCLRLVPSAPTIRIASATGLTSTLTWPPGSATVSMPKAVAAPLLVLMVTIWPLLTTP